MLAFSDKELPHRFDLRTVGAPTPFRSSRYRHSSIERGVSSLSCRSPPGNQQRPQRDLHLETVIGMVEREGRVRARIIGGRGTGNIHPAVRANISTEAKLYTDEWDAYKTVATDYAGHERITHLTHIYAIGDVHTNTIEGFFGNLKSNIRGTYHSVSRRYLQNYLDEFCWRYSHRHDSQPMFFTILAEVQNRRGLVSKPSGQ